MKVSVHARSVRLHLHLCFCRSPVSTTTVAEMFLTGSANDGACLGAVLRSVELQPPPAGVSEEITGAVFGSHDTKRRCRGLTHVNNWQVKVKKMMFSFSFCPPVLAVEEKKSFKGEIYRFRGYNRPVLSTGFSILIISDDCIYLFSDSGAHVCCARSVHCRSFHGVRLHGSRLRLEWGWKFYWCFLFEREFLHSEKHSSDAADFWSSVFQFQDSDSLWSIIQKWSGL